MIFQKIQKNKLKKVVSVFIYYNNQLLLQLRDKKASITHPGLWGVISGEFLDCNENSLDAIKREIKEEISLTNLKNLRFVDIFIERKNENIINHVFTCIIKNNKNIKLNEGIEYSFFTKKEFFRGFKYSKKLKKNCEVVKNQIMRKFYFRTSSF